MELIGKLFKKLFHNIMIKLKKLRIMLSNDLNISNVLGIVKLSPNFVKSQKNTLHYFSIIAFDNLKLKVEAIIIEKKYIKQTYQFLNSTGFIIKKLYILFSI